MKPIWKLKSLRFLTLDHECLPDLTDLTPENQMNHCGKRDAPAGTMKLLFYKFGGTDLNTFQPTPDEYLPFFESLMNLTAGLELAHSNGVVHRDIKTPNLVTQQLRSGRFQTRFIDLGLATNRAYFPQNNDIYFSAYTYWPLDVYLLYPGRKGQYSMTGAVNSTLYAQYYDRIRRFIKYPFPFFDAQGRPTTSLSDFKQILDTSVMPRFDIMELLKRADIYSLGLFFGGLCRYFGHIPAYQRGMFKIMVANPRNPNDLKPVTELGAFGLSSSAKLWHQQVALNITKPLQQLMAAMCHMDPYQRISLADAKTRFMALVPQFRTYFQPQAVYDALRPLGFFTGTARPIPVVQDSPTNLGRIVVPTGTTPPPAPSPPLPWYKRLFTRKAPRPSVQPAPAPAQAQTPWYRRIFTRKQPQRQEPVNWTGPNTRPRWKRWLGFRGGTLTRRHKKTVRNHSRCKR